MRFPSRCGDATKFEKIASPARAKNRLCSRGLILLRTPILLYYLIVNIIDIFSLLHLIVYLQSYYNRFFYTFCIGNHMILSAI